MKFLFVFFFVGFGFQFIHAQSKALVCEDYSRHIYKLLMTNNRALNEEFVNLVEYTAYIDRLESLPEQQKENIKIGAVKNYSIVRSAYDKECTRILKLYKQSLSRGAEFKFSTCSFKPHKYFQEIGFITIYYTVILPGEEEEEEIDAIRFECIKTANGWKILDGFFDDNY